MKITRLKRFYIMRGRFLLRYYYRLKVLQLGLLGLIFHVSSYTAATTGVGLLTVHYVIDFNLSLIVLITLSLSFRLLLCVRQASLM